MVRIAVTAESAEETRVSVSPETVKKLVGLGCEVVVQSGAGLKSRFADALFEAQGAKIAGSAADALAGADILLKVGRPTPEELSAVAADGFAAAILNPFDDRPGLDALTATGRTLFAMEFMPRITRAQSMDVLSSQ
ncbi:MAG: NAD(P)(+) transhydrogenase (Re/Si-specific) subunit alpha, partial [Hyphomicrobiaceae bacterium]|nr:NAD(P)(+) transhydrogenase (Re/Si-specific) subunit alpha [Hyphomicrobiaceae bacterium]